MFKILEILATSALAIAATICFVVIFAVISLFQLLQLLFV